MLSCLSRGWGSWSGDYQSDVDPDVRLGQRKCKSALPRLSRDEEPIHRHGVTISSSLRAKSASSTPRSSGQGGRLALPKTYLTRKGALLLFSSPEESEYNPLRGFSQQYQPKGTKPDLIDLSLNIGNLQRLTCSVLQYGDKNFDPATSSISDFQTNLFLKFLKTLPDEQSQPGGDLSFYLERLKSTTNIDRFSRLNTPDVQELKSALEALDRSKSTTPVQDRPGEGRLSRPGTAPQINVRHGSARSTSSSVSRGGVLSTERLASSLKSSKLIDRSKTATPSARTRYAWTPLSDETKSDQGSGSQLTGYLDGGLHVSPQGTLIPSGQVDDHGEITLETSNSEYSFSDKDHKNDGDRKCLTPEPVQSDEAFRPKSAPCQELPPLAESPDVFVSDLRENVTPVSPLHENVPATVLTCTETRDPSLLEILTTLEESSENEKGAQSCEEQYEGSVTSAQSLEEQVIPLPPETCDPEVEGDVFESKGADQPGVSQQQEEVERTLSRISSSRRTPVSSQADVVDQEVSETVSNFERVMSPAEEVAAVSDSRPGSQSSQRDRVLTSVLPPPSPIERPAPASSPVGFFENAETEEQGEGDQVVTDETKVTDVINIPVDEESTVRTERQGENSSTPENSESVAKETTTTTSANKTLSKDTTEITSPFNTPETQIEEENLSVTKETVSASPDQSDMKLVVEIPRPGTTESAAGQTIPDPGEATITDKQETNSLVSDPTDFNTFKEQFLQDTGSDKTSVTSERYASSLHITHYQQSITEDEGLLENQESVVQELPIAEPKVEHIQDVPFTSKSSLHAIRNRSSSPVMTQHLPSSRLDKVPHPPSAISSDKDLRPSMSPTPPTGAPPAKTRTFRKGSMKEQAAINARATPETLVRNLKSQTTDSLKDSGSITPSQTESIKSKPGSASSKRGKRGKSSKGKKKVETEADRLEAEEKEMAKRKLEAKVKLLEHQIRAKEILRREQMAEAERLRREYQLQLGALQREAEELRQAEEDAKYTMEMTRRAQREDREQKRKDELERKKQLAIQNREREKRMMESARQKEQEMLESISDAEMRTNLISDMERNRDEEERLAQERFEEEMKEAQRLAEEQEERMRDLERQAEEEAMQRLLIEQEELEKKRKSLLMETQKLDEVDEKLIKEMEEERQMLEEERRQMELEEQAKLDQEAERLREIQQREQEEMERRRKEADLKKLNQAKLRHKNFNMRMNFEQIKSSQGITRPYIYSYYITWPRDIYEKPMGGDPNKKKRPGLRVKPKSAK